MKIIDRQLLNQLSAQAAGNPRLRKNFNIHPANDCYCHRLFNAIEPASYIRPHRHLDPAKDETFVIIRGKLGVVTFDEHGTVVEKVLLAAGGEVSAVNILHGAFHTAVSLKEGTIFFEAKAGPYQPLSVEEKAHWAPEEGTADANAYRESLRSFF